MKKNLKIKKLLALEKKELQSKKIKKYFIFITLSLSIVWVPFAFWIYTVTEPKINIPLLSTLIKNKEINNDEEMFQNIINKGQKILDSFQKDIGPALEKKLEMNNES